MIQNICAAVVFVWFQKKHRSIFSSPVSHDVWSSGCPAGIFKPSRSRQLRFGFVPIAASCLHRVEKRWGQAGNRNKRALLPPGETVANTESLFSRKTPSLMATFSLARLYWYIICTVILWFVERCICRPAHMQKCIILFPVSLALKYHTKAMVSL